MVYKNLTFFEKCYNFRRLSSIMLKKSRIYKVGNGLAAFIPKEIVERLDIEKGDEIKLDIVEEKSKGDSRDVLIVVME